MKKENDYCCEICEDELTDEEVEQGGTICEMCWDATSTMEDQ